MPHPSDGPREKQLPGRVPDEVYSVLEYYTHELNGADAHQTVTKSDVVRWSFYRLLVDNWDELPEEAKKVIDRDVIESLADEKPEINGGR